MFNQPYPSPLFPNNHFSQLDFFRFPDPRDRTPKEPSVFLCSNAILHYYNRRNISIDINQQRFDGSPPAFEVTDDVKNWLHSTAIERGWARVLFTGNQAFLTANVVLSPNNASDSNNKDLRLTKQD